MLAPETAKPATPPSEPASNLEQLAGELNNQNTRDAVRVQVLSIIRRCAVSASMAEAIAPLVFGIACAAMKGGRASRDKGNRAERAIVKFLKDRGFAAERVPLSGAAGGSYVGDLTVPVCGVDRIVEVKCRADGFREFYKRLVDRDILIVRADRSEPLVVLPLKLAADIAARAGGQ